MDLSPSSVPLLASCTHLTPLLLCAYPDLPWPMESSPSDRQQPFLAAPHPGHRLHHCGRVFAAAGLSAADQALPVGEEPGGEGRDQEPGD